MKNKNGSTSSKWNGLFTLENRVLNFGTMAFGLCFVLAIDFTRMGRLRFNRSVLAHFFRFPSVSEGRHGLFDITFWRSHIVSLILIKCTTQALMKAIEKTHQSVVFHFPFFFFWNKNLVGDSFNRENGSRSSRLYLCCSEESRWRVNINSTHESKVEPITREQTFLNSRPALAVPPDFQSIW